MSEDNRRRIKQHILEEIDGYKGENFTEKLLQWKNDSDNLSEEGVENIKEKLDGIEEIVKGIETITEQDIDDVLSRYV